MGRKILHLLSQRPSLTGSGVTLEALVEQAQRSSWDQEVIVGTPARAPKPLVGPLEDAAIHAIRFGAEELDFPLPGMSDVMPYESTRFSQMTSAQIERYRRAFAREISRVAARFGPRLIHSHHLWIMSALVKDLCPRTPLVVHCHATALRQLERCPELAPSVIEGIRKSDRFVALHRGQAAQISSIFDVEPSRITVVGAGYREDLFHRRERAAPETRRGNILYAGKLSDAKGLPWLLEAFAQLSKKRSSEPVTLHIAGSGAGDEAEAILARMNQMRGEGLRVEYQGRLDQAALAGLMRRCAIFALPSFYEGLPLVLVEAFACGCRPLCTALPVVISDLAPKLGAALEVVPMPRLIEVDRPDPRDLPRFVDDLEAGLERALDMDASPPQPNSPDDAKLLEAFTWSAVFERIEGLWLELLHSSPS